MKDGTSYKPMATFKNPSLSCKYQSLDNLSEKEIEEIKKNIEFIKRRQEQQRR